MPPLRQRPEDIPKLTQFFIQKYGRTKDKPVTGIAPEAMALLTRYAWPGNVRELEHVIERAVVLTPHPIILSDDLPQTVQTAVPVTGGQPEGWMTLDALERDYIARALQAHQGDVGKTAEILGIHRRTLLRKLQHYGMATT
jgi:DNA-binding NtrC family response regulator